MYPSGSRPSLILGVGREGWARALSWETANALSDAGEGNEEVALGGIRDGGDDGVDKAADCEWGGSAFGMELERVVASLGRV